MGDVEKIDVFVLMTTCTSFNDVRGSGSGGFAQLGPKTIPLIGRKLLGGAAACDDHGSYTPLDSCDLSHGAAAHLTPSTP